MIAMKREVAVHLIQTMQVFRGANVKLRKLATSHCTNIYNLLIQRRDAVWYQ